MATVQTVIDRSLRLLGRLGSGRSPTAQETADCLIALNGLLESWRNERLLVYSEVEKSLTLVVGTATYTIGPGGDIDTTRPLSVPYAFMRENGIDYPVRIIDSEDWNSLPEKSTTYNITEYLYYNPTLPTGTLNLYPVPNAANTLYLTLWTPTTNFSAATETIALPPGYERALTYHLAVEISPEYGEAASDAVSGIARESKAAIKRTNRPSMRTNTTLGSLFHPRRADIRSDGA